MEGRTANEEVCPHLLDLIPKERQWLMNRDRSGNYKSSEERKLELRLGPPGEEWTSKDHMKERNELLLYLGYLSSVHQKGQNTTSSTFNGCNTHKNSGSDNAAGAILSSPWSFQQAKCPHNQQQSKASTFLQLPSTTQSLPVMVKEVPQPFSTKVVDLNNGERKAFLPSSASTAVPNSSQKRTAPGPVVGWPPIRSFRKNLASNWSKPSSDSQQQDAASDKASGKKPVDNSCIKGMFVKINMDGVPIGRKVDLHAYSSYEQLSSAVDELFSGLLAAQRDSSAGGIQNKKEEEKSITGLLDGSGEYTLVYEDNEGDRMLVGDVPWHMFVSTVKRLRVLKSSELPSLSIGSKQEKNPSATASK